MLATLAFIALFTPCSRSSANVLQEDREVIVEGDQGHAIDEYLRACEAFGFSGCVLVEQDGQVLVRKGYGMAQPNEGIPNTPETLYDIASASKQVTAAAILKLEALGKLDCDDSIADYLPGVPKEHREVTLYHLLTHTSGFPRAGPGGSGPQLEPALEKYFSSKRSRKAGEKFEYYNGGYAMLAGVVEQVTGESFEDWVQKNLFDPAGLLQTGFIETARVDRDRLAAAQGSRGQLTTDYIKGWGYKGMGGVLTSVSDLSLWMRALHAGKLLPPEQLEKMLTPFRDQYACGWYVFETDKKRRVVQHGGTAPGFQSYIRHFIDDDVLICVLANREGMHWQVAWGISALVLNEDPKAASPPRIASWKEQDFERWCGTWESAGDTLHIERRGLGLVAGGVGNALTRALAPASPFGAQTRSASSSEPSEGELEQAEQRAMAILQELRAGSCELLGAKLLPHIPADWPKRVLEGAWPKHVEKWGQVREQRSLGAFFDPTSNRIRVWIQLDQERSQRSVEVAFVGGALNIFDLNARPFPATASFAPIDSNRAVGFDFTPQAPFELTLKGSNKKPSLELKSSSGVKIEFKQPEAEKR